jgi:hypothetical protein
MIPCAPTLTQVEPAHETLFVGKSPNTAEAGTCAADQPVPSVVRNTCSAFEVTATQWSTEPHATPFMT